VTGKRKTLRPTRRHAWQHSVLVGGSARGDDLDRKQSATTGTYRRRQLRDASLNPTQFSPGHAHFDDTFDEPQQHPARRHAAAGSIRQRNRNYTFAGSGGITGSTGSQERQRQLVIASHS